VRIPVLNTGTLCLVKVVGKALLLKLQFIVPLPSSCFLSCELMLMYNLGKNKFSGFDINGA
jgi:hypothetical protein